MKRIIAFALACILLLSGCGYRSTATSSSVPQINDITDQIAPDANEQLEPSVNTPIEVEQEDIPAFNNLNDPQLLQYVEDTVYAGLVNEFSSEDYIVENISAI